MNFIKTTKKRSVVQVLHILSELTDFTITKEGRSNFLGNQQKEKNNNIAKDTGGKGCITSNGRKVNVQVWSGLAPSSLLARVGISALCFHCLQFGFGIPVSRRFVRKTFCQDCLRRFVDL